jgi:hypothetical protein
VFALDADGLHHCPGVTVYRLQGLQCIGLGRVRLRIKLLMVPCLRVVTAFAVTIFSICCVRWGLVRAFAAFNVISCELMV